MGGDGELAGRVATVTGALGRLGPVRTSALAAAGVGIDLTDAEDEHVRVERAGRHRSGRAARGPRPGSEHDRRRAVDPRQQRRDRPAAGRRGDDLRDRGRPARRLPTHARRQPADPGLRLRDARRRRRLDRQHRSLYAPGGTRASTSAAARFVQNSSLEIAWTRVLERNGSIAGDGWPAGHGRVRGLFDRLSGGL